MILLQFCISSSDLDNIFCTLCLRRMSIWDLDIVSSFGNKAYFRNGSIVCIFLGPSCVKEIQSRFSSSQEGSSVETKSQILLSLQIYILLYLQVNLITRRT